VIAKPLGLDVEGVKANFFSAYEAEGAQYQTITGAPIASTQEVETYSWIAELTAFDYWDKTGTIPDAVANINTYTLANRPYGLNWTVSDHEVRHDKTGQINLRARQMGAGAAHWYNDQLATTIEGATSGNLFDGVPFFSASHPTTDGSTASNSLTTGYDLAQAALEEVIYTMRGFTGRSGKRLGVRPSHLVVPPELEFTAKRILLTNQEVAGGVRTDSDVLKGRIELIVLDALTDSNAWYVMDLTKPIRPFFFQENLALRVMDNSGNLTDSWMKNRTYKFSADGECAFGKSLWFLCVKCNPS
jgi:phage major head subunit gpT-like protein